MSARLTDRDRIIRTVTEAEWQKTVQDMLTATGWLWYHAPDNRPGKNGRVQGIKAGFPDLVAVRGTRVLYLELKRETGKASADQIRWLAALTAAGQEAHVFRPSDVARVAQLLAPNWAP